MRYSQSDESGVKSSYFIQGIATTGYMQMSYNDDDEPYVDYNFTAQWDAYGFLNCLEINPNADGYANILAQPFALALGNPISYKTGVPGTEVKSSGAPARVGHTLSAAPVVSMQKTMLVQATYEKPVRAKFAPIAK